MAKKVYDVATNKWVLPSQLTPKEEPVNITDPIEIANQQLKISKQQLGIAMEQIKIAKSTNTMVIFIAIPFIIAVVIVVGAIWLGGLVL